MATAAATARPAVDFVFSGEASQFQGLIHVMMDRLLHLVEFLLGVEEAASNRVLKQTITVLLKIRDFFARQLHG